MIQTKKLDEAFSLINRTRAREALILLKKLSKDSQYIKNARYHYYLGLAYEKTMNLGDAIESYKNCLKLDINNGLPYHRIARILAKDEQQLLALFYIEEALKLIKNNHELYKDAAYITNTIGMADKAYEYCKKAYELAPQNTVYFTSLIFFVHKLAESTPKELYELSQEYYNKYLTQTPNLNIDFANQLQPNKSKLRLGFVSADFRTHPVSTNMYEIFKKLNKDRFDIFMYYADDIIDDVTNDFKSFANDFRFIKKMNDENCCKQIIEDNIDILFDLSGFTSGDRLRIFKRKPAPLQISFLGYFGTLGIPEIDYIISDDTLVPNDEDQYFTEKVYKLPGCHMHADLYNIPNDITELPYLKNGYITFGSMNNAHKISTKMIAYWAEILKGVENSKLYLDARALSSECNQNYLIQQFQEQGIEKDRLIMNASLERPKYLQSFSNIDIALDSTPYGGGTTTIETLRMGIPVITLYGNKWISRQASTFLKAIKHEELIAHDMNEYINKAIELASDIERLKTYRTNLKSEMKVNLNSDDYVKKFEAAIEDMWQQKCSII